MNPPQCRLLLESIRARGGSERQFQHVLRWAIAQLLATRKRREQDAWAQCLVGGRDGRPVLAATYDNCINLIMVVAACVYVLNNRQMAAEFMRSSDVHAACVNKFISQSVNISDDGEDWKWAALSALLPAVKLNYGVQQYVIQQATRRLAKVLYSGDVNDANFSRANHLKINQAVFCISKLYELDSSLHTAVANAAFPVLVNLVESLDEAMDCEGVSAELSPDWRPHLSSNPNQQTMHEMSHRVWVEMLKRTILQLIRKLLVEAPSLSSTRPLSDSLSGLGSALWHRQTCSLILLRAALVSGFYAHPGSAAAKRSKSSMDMKPNTSGAAPNPSTHQSKRTPTDGKSGVLKTKTRGGAKNVAVKTTPDKKDKAVSRSHSVAAILGPSSNLCDSPTILRELCANGHMRLLFWSLMHRREEIRFLGGEVLIICHDLVKLRDIDAKTAQEFWASFLEQGIAIISYTVRGGVPMALSRSGQNRSQLVMFPEQFVRDIASAFLSALVTELLVSSSLVERLSYALVYTRNFKLRGNIFSSLLLLASDSPVLKRVLWSTPRPASGEAPHVPDPFEEDKGGGEIFKMMLTTAQSDPAEFRVVIDILVHRIHWGQTQVASNLIKSTETIATEEQASVPNAEEGSLTSRLSAGSCVWVLSPAINDPGSSQKKETRHPVSLQSPPINLIYWHSIPLGDLIKELCSYWEGLGLMSTQGGGQQHAALRANGLRLLPGEYDVWQEVFSHMLDEYLLKVSLPRLSVNKLCQLLQLSDRYEMKMLRESYISALITRMQVDNVVQIFSCSIKPMGSSTKSLLSLQRESLAFIGQHIEILMSKKHKTKIATITDIIHQHLEQFFLGYKTEDSSQANIN